MSFLRNPDPIPWQKLAMTTLLAAGSTGTSLPVTSQLDAVDAAARGEHVTPADYETGIATQVWISQNGQKVAAVLEHDGSPLPTAVLSFDTRVEGDRARWHDWLLLANILQHLGDNAIVTTTRAYTPGDLGGGVATTASSPAAIADELLGEILDPAALPLGQAAFDAGWRDLVVGYPSGDEHDTPVEIAWPAARVGILPSGVERPSTLLDWDLRVPEEWTVETLLSALNGGAN
jgi:hypothetical protein